MKSMMMTASLLLMLSATLSFGITIDGNFDDWADVAVAIDDPDDIADDDGDVKLVQAVAEGDTLYLRMSVYGEAAPQNDQRYYYHWIVDADNSVDTGFNNGEYEGNPTGVENPIGADFFIQIGRRSGADDGIYAYTLDETTVEENFPWAAGGDSLEAAVLLASLGLNIGDTIGFSAFQEGSSNGWEVDFVQTTVFTLGVAAPTAVDPVEKLAVTWASLKY